VLQYDEAIANVLSLFDTERARVDGPRQKAIYDLRRMESFLGSMGSPHRRVPTVHIAGTKGKGSTAALCDAAFHAAGLSTGFYSSPHLHTFRERLRRDCQPVSEEEFAGLVSDLWPLRNTARSSSLEEENSWGVVTLFEFLTGMAFHCYAEAQVDVQTIEVGLGGRLDATNVVDAQVCVITSVSMDHAKILGDTIGEIAADKSGIIKPGSTPVIAPQRAEALASILKACNRVGVDPILVGRDITWEGRASHMGGQQFTVHGLRGSYELDIPLLGDYQMENAATALAAVESMSRAQGFEISAEALASGFRDVSWPCRMEVVERSPVVIVDGAHNDYSVDKLLESLPHYFEYERLLVIAGFSRDKNVDAMVNSLAPAADLAIATQARHPRALDSGELSGMLKERGAKTIAVPKPRDALEQARSVAGPRDLVLATGSLFLAAEVREAALGIEPEVYPSLKKNDRSRDP
jgi:dihydrofolate synthase/folylpolyglutamate synthase